MIGIDISISYSNFMNSFITLYRQSTGEDWAKIMFDLSRDESDGCLGKTTCGNSKIYKFLESF